MDMLVYGAGMLGKQVAHLISNHLGDQYSIKGFIDDVFQPGTQVCNNLQVIGPLTEAPNLVGCTPEKTRLVLGIGYSDMIARGRAFERAKTLGYQFETLIHPSASVEASAELGEGSIVLAGAVVDQYVTVGEISYLHNGSIIGENSVLGENNYLSAGTTFGGSTIVGNNNFFGMNSIVVNNVVIGNNNFINSGSLVYKALGDDLRIVEFREQREVSNV